MHLFFQQHQTDKLQIFAHILPNKHVIHSLVQTYNPSIRFQLRNNSMSVVVYRLRHQVF